MLTCALLLTGVASVEKPPAPRDPRTQPLTIEDALFKIESVTGRIVPVRDADGDGVGDLMVVRGGKRSAPVRIDLVSSKDGHTIRTLHNFALGEDQAFTWDGGGDCNGDSVPDLLLGLPAALGGRGIVHVISGKNAETLTTAQGDRAGDRFGASLDFAGDVDGDGTDDFVVGAPQFDPAFPLIANQLQSRDNDKKGSSCSLPEEGWVSRDTYWSERMGVRSNSPGYVCCRNARTGSELWRTNGVHVGLGFGFHVSIAGNVLVQSDLRSGEPLIALSIADGTEQWRMPHWNGLAGLAGNLDGDTRPDFFLDTADPNSGDRYSGAALVSGETRKALFYVNYPDMYSKWGITIPMGDLDGDGLDDIGIGEANFNIHGPNTMASLKVAMDIHSKTLAEMLRLESQPFVAMRWESGCALIESTCSHRVIFGVWGLPGSRRGLGLEMAPMPDVSGDGHPDVIVADQETAYVFAGPGPEPK